MSDKPVIRVAAIDVEMGMSAQTKSGVWVKPTVRLNLAIDGGTTPEQRKAIIKQGFDEVVSNIEKMLEDL